jgi:ectoine hydroxylase-related dioxygenase (phytanoyl-CoA dioxygenase family)/multidrug efflux pump subunit AcrA (membrane-fusion protein)
MKWASKTINGFLSRLDLRLSRASSFSAHYAEFHALQLELAQRQTKLDETQAQLDEKQTQLDETLATLKSVNEAREQERLLKLSKLRWQGDEQDAGLTWGVPMVGDAFVRFVQAHAPLTDRSHLVEIGPGYGRILSAILQEGLPFKRYTGLEISSARVARLRRQFQDPRIEFREADILSEVDLNGMADLTFSSAVFEHLYPDFGAALANIARFTRQGGAVVLDFIGSDEKLEHSAAWFDQETYMRIYSRTELNALFEARGLTLNDVGTISFGQDILEREITRTIVFASKGTPAPAIESLMPAQKLVEVSSFDTFVHRLPAPCDHMTLEPPIKPAFRSSFGGLWTDLSSADAILAGKVAIGELLPAEAKLVDAWKRDGFVILPGAVDPAAIDAALADFERACDGTLPRKISYWDDQGLHLETASHELLRKRDAKLLDLHDVSEATQAIIFAEPVSRFLQILFERPALAFQSLGFYYGSQQPLHEDYVFVRVSSPLEFVASWIALEDIRPGSGQLEYYPGSHALPHHLFGGSRFWPEFQEEEVQHFSDTIHAQAREAGLTLQRFEAKKGDVLIWSAALMHGGSPVTDPNLTRKSLVTHYCPADLQPMFAYKGGRSKRKSVAGNYVIAEPWD